MSEREYLIAKAATIHDRFHDPAFMGITATGMGGAMYGLKGTLSNTARINEAERAALSAGKGRLKSVGAGLSALPKRYRVGTAIGATGIVGQNIRNAQLGRKKSKGA